MENNDFARAMFGDAYVNMTEQNIKNGEPLGVYAGSPMFDMFARITLNNLRVAFLCFAAGIFFSIFSYGVLIYNSIMVGTFMYFFYSRGLSGPFNYTVFLHGTFELLSMVIEAAAGIMIGNSLLFFRNNG